MPVPGQGNRLLKEVGGIQRRGHLSWVLSHKQELSSQGKSDHAQARKHKGTWWAQMTEKVQGGLNGAGGGAVSLLGPGHEGPAGGWTMSCRIVCHELNFLTVLGLSLALMHEGPQEREQGAPESSFCCRLLSVRVQAQSSQVT